MAPRSVPQGQKSPGGIGLNDITAMCTFLYRNIPSDMDRVAALHCEGYSSRNRLFFCTRNVLKLCASFIRKIGNQNYSAWHENCQLPI